MGVLTVSSALPNQQRTNGTNHSACIFQIGNEEFDYDAAINEELEKFDEHLCSYIASTIECKIIKSLRQCHEKACSQCIGIFNENELVKNNFISKKMQYACNPLKVPCLSTVHIIKASNKIFDILERRKHQINTVHMHDSTLKTIMSLLPLEQLYTQSNFELHGQHDSHKETFIHDIVLTYMKQKSNKIGNRITEQEKGEYIRHNNKKQVHISGQ